MKNLTLLALLVLILSSCGGKKKFEKKPVDDIVRDLSNEPTYSIILYDMDVEGTFTSVYRHQYQIIRERDSIPYDSTTGWLEVPEKYFWANEDNMGMAIVNKGADGQVTRVASPPGYHNYVGNTRYGYWHNSGGSSFWTFYGQYAFMSHMFGMANRPIYQREYRDYYNGGYRGSRAYYGPTNNGNPKYGTNSAHNRTTRPDFFERRKTKSGFSQSKHRSGRTSRTSSRSGKSGSLRSRGGSYGK